MQIDLFYMPAPTTPEPEPQTQKTPPLFFTSFEDIRTAISNIKKDEFTFDEFVRLKDYFMNNEAAIVPMINKLTIADIKKYIYVFRSNEKKARLVTQVYEAFLSSFNIDPSEGMISYSPFSGETYESKLKEKYALHTPEMFEQWKAKKKAKAEAHKKALTNPETLEEFSTFITYRGEARLTTEQRELYDELRTGITKEQRQLETERKAKIAAVEIGKTDMIILETVHTKKQIPLFVVRLSERVERDIFNELNQRAKQLGGYYSSYRGNGAIPGFTFEKKEAAELFIQIKDGDINAIELRKAINAERQQERAENLQEKAENINERATDDLNRDRKDNTARRARMASHAEQSAAAEIIFSITLNSIAEGIKAGTVNHLEKMSTIVQLEEMESILSRCKWKYIQDKNVREGDFKFVPEIIDLAKFPYPTLWKEHTVTLLKKLHKDAGKKLAALRIYKRLQSCKGDVLDITEGRSMDDYKTLFLYKSAGIDRYEIERFKSQYMKYERIVRMGITDIYSLRAALRELVRIKENSKLTPEQQKVQAIRELERKFVGKRIDGFFPTPEILAREVVEKANIEEGNRILEPSAGLGHIAEIISELHPDNHLCCIESNYDLSEALKLKGFDNTLHMDFLDIAGINPDTKFDRIIMNPPFESLKDIDHVNQAWKLLNAGGRIVAIMAGNKQRDTNKVREFMNFVDEFGTWEQNPEGSFASAFRPTGVNTITVILDKP